MFAYRKPIRLIVMVPYRREPKERPLVAFLNIISLFWYDNILITIKLHCYWAEMYEGQSAVWYQAGINNIMQIYGIWKQLKNFRFMIFNVHVFAGSNTRIHDVHVCNPISLIWDWCFVVPVSVVHVMTNSKECDFNIGSYYFGGVSSACEHSQSI